MGIKKTHLQKKTRRKKKGQKSFSKRVLVMQISLAGENKNIPPSSAPSLAPKSSVCFFVRGPRIENG